MASEGEGLIAVIYDAGIRTELLPPLIFLGVGVLTDFRPLLGRPLAFLLGAAAQLGIFVAALGAFYLLDFTPQEAGAIGIIGGADGPTSIFLTIQLAPHLLGPVAVAAYSYMSLVPIIQPPIMRMLTTKHERAIDMPQGHSGIPDRGDSGPAGHRDPGLPGRALQCPPHRHASTSSSGRGGRSNRASGPPGCRLCP